MNSIRINGLSIVGGRTITVTSNHVFVDGKDVTPDAKDIRIEVSGNVDRLEADACNLISVAGDVGSVSTLSGDVSVSGAVGGLVQTMSGDVDCGPVGGSVTTLSGDIRHVRV
ncbi:hypothetical protein [Bradyrhizobium pachyrhizi]|uniref:hypothetical protein n=1 Tax=Bradyrhizobium pachyrhizi TaxID=280333 RepID=UPI00067E040A|nr:hypothetical protein [Bradyrhizobium pachyrhizi]